MTIEVFWGSGSPFAWTVLLALEVKAVPYESRLLSFSDGDHKKPEFLALNPRGKVPAIRDGEYVLPESLAILAYLDRKHPEPPLFGRTPEETGRIWKAISDDVCYLQPASDKIVGPAYFGTIAGNEEAMREGGKEMACELARITGDLAEHAWLAGDTMSAADLVTYPQLTFLFRLTDREAVRAVVPGFEGWRERWPAIAAWCARIESLPGYDRTYPPHWRED